MNLARKLEDPNLSAHIKKKRNYKVKYSVRRRVNLYLPEQGNPFVASLRTS